MSGLIATFRTETGNVLVIKVQQAAREIQSEFSGNPQVSLERDDENDLQLIVYNMKFSDVEKVHQRFTGKAGIKNIEILDTIKVMDRGLTEI